MSDPKHRREYEKFLRFIQTHPNHVQSVHYKVLLEGNRLLKEFLINRQELSSQQQQVFTVWLKMIPKDSPSYKIYSDFMNRPPFVDVLMLAPKSLDNPNVKDTQNRERVMPFLKKVLPANNCISGTTSEFGYPVISIDGDIEMFGEPDILPNNYAVLYRLEKTSKEKMRKNQRNYPNNAYRVGNDLWYSNLTKKQVADVIRECGHKRFVLFYIGIRSYTGDNPLDRFNHANALHRQQTQDSRVVGTNGGYWSRR
jgi:hypothetical protein